MQPWLPSCYGFKLLNTNLRAVSGIPIGNYGVFRGHTNNVLVVNESLYIFEGIRLLSDSSHVSRILMASSSMDLHVRS